MVRACLLAMMSASACFAVSIAPFYAGSYTVVLLGSAPGVSGPYGGINFLNGNLNTLLLGGLANQGGGVIDQVGVTRDVNGHINGFTGVTSQLSTAPNIDGGLVYSPNGDLIYTGYPINTIGFIKPGSSSPDKTVGAPVSSSVGTLGFVPAGFTGAGNFVVGSYTGGTFCVATLTPDGSGTYNVGACGASASGFSGPEGIVWVPQGSALFPGQNVLVSEYQSNRVSAYQVGASGLPDPATRQDFVTGLSGAEGAVIDPVTGDFLFSTFGGGNQIIEVQGFAAAAAATPEPAGFVLIGAGVALLLVGRLRLRRLAR